MKPAHVLAVRVVMVGVLSSPFLLPGCGGGTGPTIKVSGKVTLDGKPFSEGCVWFTCPKSGAGFQGKLEPDGTYALSILDAQIDETYGVHIGGVEPEDTGDNPIGIAPPPIPSKYWESTTSGLTAKIEKAKKLTFDFALKSK